VLYTFCGPPDNAIAKMQQTVSVFSVDIREIAIVSRRLDKRRKPSKW